MTIIKRDRNSSKQDLIQELSKFCSLLLGQGEEDAVEDLNKAQDLLKQAEPNSAEMKAALKILHDAFEDEHELNAYTHTRESQGEWGDAEELALVSSRVLNLMKRLS